MSGQILKSDILQEQEIINAINAIIKSLDGLLIKINDIKKDANTITFKNLQTQKTNINKVNNDITLTEIELNKQTQLYTNLLIKRAVAETETAKSIIATKEQIKQKNVAIKEEITGTKAAIATKKQQVAIEKQQSVMTKLLIAAKNTEAGSLSRLNALNNIYKARMKELNVLIPAQAKTYDFLNKKILMNQQAMTKMAMGAQQGGRQFNMLQWQIMQVSREMPAFAYGINVGIGALSNNLPMLADEINNVRRANKLLAAEGKATVPVFKQIAKSLFSWQTALVAAVTMATLYGKEIGDWIKKIFNAKNAVEELTLMQDSLTEANKRTIESFKKEAVELDLLYKTAIDETKSRADRNKIIDELQKKYPSYLANFSNEEIMAGKAAVAYDNLKTSIIETAKARVNAEEIAKNQIKIETELQPNLEVARKKIQDFYNENKNFIDASLQELWAMPQSTLETIFWGTEEVGRRRKKEFETLRGEFQTIFAQIDELNAASKKLEQGIEVPLLATGTEDTKSKQTKEKEADIVSWLEDLYEAYYVKKLSFARNDADKSRLIRMEMIGNELSMNNLTLTRKQELLAELRKLDDEYLQSRSDMFINNLYEQLDEEIIARSAQYRDEISGARKRSIEMIRTQTSYSIDLLKMDYDVQQKIIKSAQTTEEEKSKAARRIAELQIQLNELVGESNSKVEEAKRKQIETTLRYISDSFSQVFEIQQQFSDNSLQRAENRYEREIRLAGDSTDRQLVAQKKLEKEKRKIAMRQAIAEKAQAVFNIGLSTAQAIMGIWSDFPKVDFGITAAIMSGVVGALGAAQLASVLSAPLPQYEKGGIKDKKGDIIVGEKGTELMIFPSGKQALTPNKASVLSGVPIGTEIIPNDKTTQILAQQAITATYDAIDMRATNSYLKNISDNTKKQETVSYENGYKIIRRKGYTGKFKV